MTLLCRAGGRAGYGRRCGVDASCCCSSSCSYQCSSTSDCMCWQWHAAVCAASARTACATSGDDTAPVTLVSVVVATRERPTSAPAASHLNDCCRQRLRRKFVHSAAAHHHCALTAPLTTRARTSAISRCSPSHHQACRSCSRDPRCCSAVPLPLAAASASSQQRLLLPRGGRRAIAYAQQPSTSSTSRRRCFWRAVLP